MNVPQNNSLALINKGEGREGRCVVNFANEQIGGEPLTVADASKLQKIKATIPPSSRLEITITMKDSSVKNIYITNDSKDEALVCRLFVEDNAIHVKDKTQGEKGNRQLTKIFDLKDKEQSTKELKASDKDVVGLYRSSVDSERKKKHKEQAEQPGIDQVAFGLEGNKKGDKKPEDGEDAAAVLEAGFELTPLGEGDKGDDQQRIDAEKKRQEAEQQQAEENERKLRYLQKQLQKPEPAQEPVPAQKAAPEQEPVQAPKPKSNVENDSKPRAASPGDSRKEQAAKIVAQTKRQIAAKAEGSSGASSEKAVKNGWRPRLINLFNLGGAKKGAANVEPVDAPKRQLPPKQVPQKGVQQPGPGALLGVKPEVDEESLGSVEEQDANDLQGID